MIKGVYLKNFKCHKELTLEFKPLTLLFGPNGSGKSAVIQSLLLLRQSSQGIGEEPLNFSTEELDLGDYGSVLFPKAKSLWIGVILDKTKEEKGIGRVRILKLMWTIKRSEKVYVDKLNVALEFDGVKDNLKIEGKRLRRSLLMLAYMPIVEFFFKDKDKSEKAGVKIRSGLKIEKNEQISFIFGGIVQTMMELAFYLSSNYLQHIGMVRYPFEKRVFSFKEGKEVNIGAYGKYTPEVLLNLLKNDKEKARALRKFLRSMKLAEDIRQVPAGKVKHENYFQIQVKNGVWVNIADAWSGLHQALPLIVQGLTAPKDSLLLWEQPEIHLHPRAQLAMGDFLLEASKNKTLVVETHSDLILGRILRRIAEKPELRERIAMYYFDKRGPEAEVTELKIDEYGQIENAPEGFFEEGYQEASAHVEAIEERQSEE